MVSNFHNVLSLFVPKREKSSGQQQRQPVSIGASWRVTVQRRTTSVCSVSRDLHENTAMEETSCSAVGTIPRQSNKRLPAYVCPNNPTLHPYKYETGLSHLVLCCDMTTIITWFRYVTDCGKHWHFLVFDWSAKQEESAPYLSQGNLPMSVGCFIFGGRFYTAIGLFLPVVLRLMLVWYHKSLTHLFKQAALGYHLFTLKQRELYTWCPLWYAAFFKFVLKANWPETPQMWWFSENYCKMLKTSQQSGQSPYQHKQLMNTKNFWGFALSPGFSSDLAALEWCSCEVHGSFLKTFQQFGWV